MRILVANDDGIDAPGIRLLASKLVNFGEVTIVAPDRPRSASSHCIIFSPIELTEVKYDFGVKAYKISGTPADCVRIATSVVGEFDLVFSGINNGLNLGTDTIYSGTVAVAREAFIQGIPSVAISCDVNDFAIVDNDLDNLLNYIFSNNSFSKEFILNINYPVKNSILAGYKYAFMGKKRFKTTFELKDGVCKTISEKIVYDTNPNSDVYLAGAGYVTFVPLAVDMTHYDVYNEIVNK